MSREDPGICSSMLLCPDKEHLSQIMWSRNSLFSQQICNPFCSHLTYRRPLGDKQEENVWQLKGKTYWTTRTVFIPLSQLCGCCYSCSIFWLERESGKVQKCREMLSLAPHLRWFRST